MENTLKSNYSSTQSLFSAADQAIPPPSSHTLSLLTSFYYPTTPKPLALQKTASFTAPTTTSDQLDKLLKERSEATGKLWVESLGNRHLSDRLRTIDVEWHPPWKLMRVISGHTGWVRSVSVDPTNSWFATGSNDKTIKIWDLASGALKLTLHGHILSVREVIASERHPYVFSCGEDKKVFCWDLEYNKIIRAYHGHLSGVYCMSLHPTLDILTTGGRDCVGRVWDIRTKAQIRVLEGHRNTVCSVASSAAEPQVITGSSDCTVKLWDITSGKPLNTLTRHKKGVRGLTFHHTEYTFLSAGADNIKLWKCPEGKFLRNFGKECGVLNSICVNEENVLVTGGDNGTLLFWDYSSGHNFCRLEAVPQPGSLDCEAGVLASCFDQSGLRLLTAECDKTIKIWREDEEATPLTHPIPNEARVFLRDRD